MPLLPLPRDPDFWVLEGLKLLLPGERKQDLGTNQQDGAAGFLYCSGRVKMIESPRGGHAASTIHGPSRLGKFPDLFTDLGW